MVVKIPNAKLQIPKKNQSPNFQILNSTGQTALVVGHWFLEVWTLIGIWYLFLGIYTLVIKEEIPGSKLQNPKKNQSPNFQIPKRRLADFTSFGHWFLVLWTLIGIWYLFLGILFISGTSDD